MRDGGMNWGYSLHSGKCCKSNLKVLKYDTQFMINELKTLISFTT
jgi:hypothetical protein